MANRLRNLIITKVALCPKGQNPEADIVFFKSDESGSALEAGSQVTAPQTLSKEDNVKDYSKMSLEELKKELEARDAATPPETVSKEDFATLQKALDVQAEEIKKANDALAKAQDETRIEKEKREKIEAIEKGKRDFPNLPLTDEEKGSLVQSMTRMDAAVAATMTKALNAGNAALKDLTTSVGQETGAEDETAKDKLKKAAEAIQAADPKLSYSQAYDLACQKNADLYKEARTEA